MKPTSHIFIVVAAALLAACSSDLETSSPLSGIVASRTIGFDNYIGRSATRGTVVDNDNLSTQGFGVFAMKSWKKYGSTANDTAFFVGNFMSNVKVGDTSSKVGTGENATDWNTTTTYYWPDDPDSVISFIAYAPYKKGISLVDSTGKSSGDKTDLSFVTYTIDNDPAQTFDLLYNNNYALNQKYDRDLKTAGTDTNDLDDKNRVKMQFYHATARLGFAVTSSILEDSENYSDTETESDAQITVNKVLLCGDSAVYKDAGATPAGAFYKTGYLNLNPTATPTGVPVGGGTSEGVPGYVYAKKGVLSATRGTKKDKDGKDSVGAVWKGTFTSNAEKCYFVYENSDSKKMLYDGEYSSTATNVKKVWNPGTENTVVIKGTKSGNTGSYTYSVNGVGNGSDGYIFAIPEAFGGFGFDAEGNVATGTEVTHKSSISTGDPNRLFVYVNYTLKYKGSPNLNGGKGITCAAICEVRKMFEAGKAYIILIDIGGKDSKGNQTFRPVTFTIENTDGWGNENTSGIGNTGSNSTNKQVESVNSATVISNVMQL